MGTPAISAFIYLKPKSLLNGALSFAPLGSAGHEPE